MSPPRRAGDCHRTAGRYGPDLDKVPSTCPLCKPELGPILYEGRSWRLVLNWNQRLLGMTFLAVIRHVEEVSGLTFDEWIELLQLIRRVTTGIEAIFAPDHWNMSFLMNKDRHVHLHLIPRYAAPREFAGSRFDDRAFGRPLDLLLPDYLMASSQSWPRQFVKLCPEFRGSSPDLDDKSQRDLESRIQ